MTRRANPAAGFTLVEAIMVIVITGILASAVAVFIAKPVEGYVDSARRAELTDAADVALRRMTRDIRLALPNSLRIRDTTTPGNCAVGTCYIEFIMTSTGGRNRDRADGSTGGDFFSFTDTVDQSFDVLGTMPANPAITVNDYLVVYNLGPGYEPANAYLRDSAQCDATPVLPGCNIAKITGVAGNTLSLDANPFAYQSPPLASPDSRFQVVPGEVRAVTFACPVSTGPLSRYWNYGFNAAQPVAFGGGSSATLATGASCVINYTANATGRNGLLFVQLSLSSGGETVTLFQQIHVDNAP
ncbi:MAG: prepilin-type N-terminal cleavage/methylation domain-containing protein [Sulfuritalea sp.]|nr:prepilin-type N-terminal cleavage/methylation domain-containing protein [Sulfuritalea sp.]